MLGFLTLSACTQSYKAPKQPVVSISEMQISDSGTQAQVELILRNDYEADYIVVGGRLTIAVGATALLEVHPQGDVPIPSYGIEVFSFGNQRIVSEEGVERLMELERGERGPLAYHVFGTLIVNKDRTLRVDQRGLLHATPGKPGHFRGPSGINRGDRRLRGRN